MKIDQFILKSIEGSKLIVSTSVSSKKTQTSPIYKLGTVFDLPNTNLQAVILNKRAVEKMTGKTLEEIFRDCPSNKTYQIRDGYIVDLNLYQQVALLRVINETNPKLKIAMFNYRASEIIYKVFNSSNVHNKLKNNWFWTGEKIDPKKKWHEQNWADPGLVNTDRLEKLEDSLFVNGYIFYGRSMYRLNPGYHDNNGVVIFGAPK